ncbi:MAG: hydrogenase small subunit [bacterium]
MALTRREFLKMFSGLTITAGFSQALIPEIYRVMVEASETKPAVLWLDGMNCTGCSISLLNSVHPSIKEVLLEIISMGFHPNIMAASGDLALSVYEDAIKNKKGQYYLIVEGAIPAASGKYCGIGERDGKGIPAGEWVTRLADSAKSIIAVGQCASYGGIPAAAGNYTGAAGVQDYLKKPVINIPGCPPHPDWIVGTIVHILLYGMPELDRYGRPKMFFGKCIHDNCERRKDFDEHKFAKHFSEEGCLYELGCKGPVTYGDCPQRRWNNHVNWCVQSGAGCRGCTEPGWPDNVSPLFERVPFNGR